MSQPDRIEFITELVTPLAASLGLAVWGVELGGAAQFNAPDSQSEGSRQRGDQFGDEFDSIGLTHAS